MPLEGDAFLISATSFNCDPTSAGANGIGASAASARSRNRSSGSAAVRAASSWRLSATIRSRIVLVAVVCVIETPRQADVALQRVDRLPLVDCPSGKLRALTQAPAQPGDDQRRARVEEDEVAHRTFLAGEDAAHPVGVCRRLAATHGGAGSRCQAGI